MKLSSLLGERHRARVAIEEPDPESRFKAGDGTAHPRGRHIQRLRSACKAACLGHGVQYTDTCQDSCIETHDLTKSPGGSPRHDHLLASPPTIHARGSTVTWRHLSDDVGAIQSRHYSVYKFPPTFWINATDTAR